MNFCADCRGVTLGGYLFCLVLGCIAIPHIYPPAKWCGFQPALLISAPNTPELELPLGSIP